MHVISFSAYRKARPVGIIERLKAGEGPLFYLSAVAGAMCLYAALWITLALGAIAYL